MTIPVKGNGRFRTLMLTIDTAENIGPQVVVGLAAGYSYKQLCAAFGKSRQYLSKLASEARDRQAPAR